MKRVGGWLVNVVLVGAIALAVVVIVPSAFGWKLYAIASGSMEPTFARGALIFDEVVPSSELAVEDVITYRPPPDSGVTELVSHRIVSITTQENGERVFRTKGDANDTEDPWTFTLGEEQARYRAHIPWLGYPFLLFQSRQGWLLVLCALGLALGALAIVWLVKLLRTPRPVVVSAAFVSALALTATAWSAFTASATIDAGIQADHVARWLTLLSDSTDNEPDPPGGYARRRGSSNPVQDAATGIGSSLLVNLGGYDTSRRTAENVFSLKAASPLPEGATSITVSIDRRSDGGAQPVRSAALRKGSFGASSQVTLSAGQRAWVDVEVDMDNLQIDQVYVPKIVLTVLLNASGFVSYEVPTGVTRVRDFDSDPDGNRLPDGLSSAPPWVPLTP